MEHNIYIACAPERPTAAMLVARYVAETETEFWNFAAKDVYFYSSQDSFLNVFLW